MEDLTKQQLILLALLVSFVTSIATGIATVSLLDQAPPKVTQVINRVVERTVEQVVPEQAASPAQVVTKEETVVVREDELITESIAAVSESVVRIFARRGNFLAMGFVINTTGLIATSGESIDERGEYEVVLSSGERVDAHAVFDNEESTVALLKLDSTGDTKLVPVSVGGDQNIQLGYTALALTGETDNQVAMGIVARLDRPAVNQGGVEQPVTGIYTNIPQENVTLGAPLFNLFGEVIGMRTRSTTSVFIPMSLIKTFVAGLNS